MTLSFDPSKASTNINTHSVSFQEAYTSIHDPDAIWIYDGEHSFDEDRYLAVYVDLNDIKDE